MKTWKLLVFIALASVGVEALAADEVHHTFTGQTSVTFDWRGAAATEPTLDYRIINPDGTTCPSSLGSPLGNTLNLTNGGVNTPSPLPTSSSGPFWEASITGLLENTVYCYAIDGGPVKTFMTPLPRSSSDFIVYAAGDFGSSNTYPNIIPVQNIIANALPDGLYPDFVLMLGDLTYGDVNGADDTDQHFNDVMSWSQEIPYMPVWGNHEWSTSLGLDNLNDYEGRFGFQNHFDVAGADIAFGNGPGEDWYWFDHGHVRFVAYPEPYTSASWPDWFSKVQPIMQAAQADPDIDFIVTFGHRFAYKGSSVGSSRLKGHLDNLAQLYPKYRLNLCGHAHSYARTDPSIAFGVTHILVGTGRSSTGIVKLYFSDGAIVGKLVNTVGTIKDSFTIGTPVADPTPPEVFITEPVAGTLSGTVPVSATATDNIGVVGVQFKLDGNDLGAEDTTAPYSVSWDTTTAINGEHTLFAIARDAAGNATSADSITVTVNNSLSTVTFPPAADASIKSASPTTNFGSATILEVDNSPVEQFLMKFTVSGIAGQTVTSAKLRLYNVNASNMGGDFYRADNNYPSTPDEWTETGVNWNNAPASDITAFATLGAVSANTWYEVNVTQLITGDGTYSLRVKATSSNGADYNSKEVSQFAPQLVVTVQQ